jgi:hypothetical protein
MKKLLYFLFPICILAVPAYAQTGTTFTENLASKIKRFTVSHEIEKAYLQLDKPCYAAGDTIFFKAYVTAGNQHMLSNISGILHVDLINAASHINQSLKLQLNNGLGWGDFVLPDTLRGGNYRIRAYTQWMQNNNYADVFDQTIQIGNLKNPATVYENASSNNASTLADVQFFPEGGSIVADLRSNMGFKAIGTDGLGTDIKGIIIDNTNKPVAQFASSHLGMGSFSFVPEKGKTYRAKYKFKDSVEHIANLPTAAPEGMVLSVSNFADRVTVTINTSQGFYEQNQNKAYTLAVYSGGILSNISVKPDAEGLNFNIPLDKFATGIAQFTAFGADGTPLCERLAFIQNPADQLDINVNTAKPVYNKRDKVDVRINAIPKVEMPGKGHYSVAVIDESKVPDGNDHASILAYLLLTSDLKGYIEQPNYYFDNNTDKAKDDLDALLLTQGYRHFTWQQILTDTTSSPKFEAEKTMAIAGSIINTPNKQPVPDRNITLMDVKGGQFYSQKTDASGKFRFGDMVFTDTTRFLLNATDSTSKLKIKLTLDADNSPLKVEPVYIPGKPNADIQTYLENAKAIQTDKTLHNRMLKEVKIVSYRSSNLAGPGHADQVIDMRDNKIAGTMSTVLATKSLRGVTIWNGKAYLNGIGGKMLVVIDGGYADSFEDLNPYDIETVEVLKNTNAFIYGVSSGGGVLVFTTKAGGATIVPHELGPGLLPFKAKGVHIAREFYSPKYTTAQALGNVRPDLRSTIYWQPEVITDAKGQASFSYYNADGTGNYKVIVEGIDESGRIGHAVYRYAVK